MHHFSFVLHDPILPLFTEGTLKSQVLCQMIGCKKSKTQYFLPWNGKSSGKKQNIENRKLKKEKSSKNLTINLFIGLVRGILVSGVLTTVKSIPTATHPGTGLAGN